jgi:imidazolonepropionase-like amidohydrolase
MDNRPGEKVISPKSVKKKIETRDKTFRTTVEAYKAGVPFAITVDHPVIPIEMFPLMAALCVREGLPETAALDAVTVNGARILGVEKQTGAIAKGLLADLVVSGGHPLDARSRVELVLVAGETAYAK